MSWESEDGEAQFAEHIAECDACAAALARGEDLFGPDCIDEYNPADHPDWSGVMETRIK